MNPFAFLLKKNWFGQMPPDEISGEFWQEYINKYPGDPSGRLVVNYGIDLATDKGATMSELPLYRQMRPDNLRAELELRESAPFPGGSTKVRVHFPGASPVSTPIVEKSF